MAADESIRQRRVRELFDACVDLPAAERRRLLDDSEPGIRAAVEDLLAADEENVERLQRLDSPVIPEDSAARPGESVGRYEVLRELGRGGMGVVHLARDTELDRTLVLKFLTPAIASDEEARERFVREARAASALDHPNICTVFDIGSSQAGGIYIAMAYYEGKTLKERISEGPVTVEETVDIALHVLSGLGRAHEAGIVHRDIKPANVMLTDRGEVKLLDFGLAKTSDPGLTQSGMMMGTLGYMSPEQIQGQAVDARTDLWSTGVVMYEMLSGRRPFAAEYDQAVLYSIVNQEADRLDEIAPHVPETLADLVHSLLQKDPAMRPESARVVEGALAQFSAAPGAAARPPRSGRRRFLAAMGIAALAIATGSALFVWSTRSGGSLQDLLAEGDHYRSLEGAQNTRLAIERYREAIRRDSSYAPAYAKLSQAYVLLDASESEFLARQFLEQAASLDSMVSEAHVARGLVLELYDHDWDGAEQAFRQAVSLDPANSVARYELGWLLIRTGRVEEGAESMQRARSLDSSSPLTLYGIGVADYYSERYDSAARVFWQLFQSEPSHLYAWVQMLLAYLNGGQFVAATEAVNRIPDPGPFYRSPLGAYYFAATGVEGSAREVVTELGDEMSAWDRAKVFAKLGERERALDTLEGAMDAPPRVMSELLIEPAFESLREDARFQDMVRRLGLRPATE